MEYTEAIAATIVLAVTLSMALVSTVMDNVEK